MCQVNVLEVYSSSLLLSLQTLLIIKAMALSNSIDSSMNKSQVVVGKTKSEFRQIYLAYPDILIEAWHPLVWDSRDFILRNSMTNTKDTWRWHVSDKNSAKLIFIFHFSEKNVLLHESMSYMICVFIHWDAILMKDVDDLILSWSNYLHQLSTHSASCKVYMCIGITCVSSELWSCYRSRYLRKEMI